MPSENKGDYEVGYGKPPRDTRFPKGQSGNPRGRPSGAKNLKTLLSEALNEPVIVTENGGRRKVTKRQAIITQLVNRSAHRRFSCHQNSPRHGARDRKSDRAGTSRDLRLQRGGRGGSRSAQGAVLASEYIRKEEVVTKVLAARGRHPGLVHVISAMEPCDASRDSRAA
jgi:hypothetical protein